LTIGALAGLFDASLNGFSTAIRVALAVGVIGLAAAVNPFLSFVRVSLDGFELTVRGLWRVWRFPASFVEEALSRDRDGFTTVRVTLREPVPGLGRRFRFIGRMLTSHTGFEAELIETAGRFRAPGA